MIVKEILEGFKQVWARGKKGLVRKYRCTDGAKKGRTVAKPSTCATAVSQKKSVTLAKTRRTKGASQEVKRSKTMHRPTSKRVRSANKRLKIKPRKRK
tara:strand:- start:134 stop:427 length:294 start_codon:yes stop_codon:yes gene_type:complete